MREWRTKAKRREEQESWSQTSTAGSNRTAAAGREGAGGEDGQQRNGRGWEWWAAGDRPATSGEGRRGLPTTVTTRTTERRKGSGGDGIATGHLDGEEGRRRWSVSL